MSLSSVVRVLSVLFFASEIALAVFKRARLRSAEVRDDGSLRALWAVIAVSVTLAVLAQRGGHGQLRSCKRSVPGSDADLHPD